MIDTNAEFQARAERRLRDEPVIWLTTVAESGTPQIAPVWFLYDGDRIVVYSHNKARRLRNLTANGRVTLNLNTDWWGSDVVIVHGTARIAPELPSAAESDAYLAKYRDQIEREKSWDGIAGFVEQYSVPIEITGLRIGGF